MPASSRIPTTIAEAVAHTLAELGVGHVFGVVGSGNFHVTNALIAAGVPFTAARHESGAAVMADAYSRMSGKLGVVTTHQGCGFTNALTGIGESAKSRTPMLVLTADVQAGAVLSNFKIDQDAAARAVGAVAARIHSPETAVADTAHAWQTAMTERRTVVLSLPLDVQSAPFVGELVVPEVMPHALVVASADVVAALVAELEAAERPVFIAGRGARAAGPELRTLAEQSGALLATSAVAKGLFNGDPANLGISGGFSSPLTAELISNADLIVGWGCAMNMWTMRQGSLIGRGARVVQVDVEEAALGAHRPIDLGVVGDAALTASATAALLSPGATRYRAPAVLEAIANRSRWRDEPLDSISTADRIDPRVVTRLLDDALPAERVVSIDSGNFMGYPSQFLDVPDEFGFCFTQAFQSIGLGLGTAIGAAFAQPQRLPVLGTGDGGFMMAISELDTAVRAELPLVVLVYDDAAYGAEVYHFQDADAEVDVRLVEFPDTDLAAVARGFGADAVTVRTEADFAEAARLIAERTPGEPGRPLVIDAKIAPDGGAWWLAEAFKGH